MKKNNSLCKVMRVTAIILLPLILWSCAPQSSSTETKLQNEFSVTPTEVSIPLEQPDISHTQILKYEDGVLSIVDSKDGSLVRHEGEGFNNFNLMNLPEAMFGEVKTLEAGLSSDLPQSHFTRTDSRSGTVSLSEEGLLLAVESISSGHLFDAWLLINNQSGLWIQQEELVSQESTYKGESVHILQPLGSLQQYDHQGNRLRSYSVELSKPRKTRRFFHVDNNGGVHFVESTGSLRNLTISGELQLALETSTDQAQSPQITAGDESQLNLLESLVRADQDIGALRAPITSAQQIIDNAQLFLDVQWTLNEENYAASKLASCAKPASIWRRPTNLSDNLVGSIVSAPPYKWGGSNSLAHFSQSIRDGAVAGDVCTCRCTRGSSCTLQDWCIDPATTGFDCSGFVSNVWQINYHSTVSLHKMAKPIHWQDLKPGDILNKPGRHVRLFMGFSGENATQFSIMESSIECGGVCAHEMHISLLKGYIPYRHKDL